MPVRMLNAGQLPPKVYLHAVLYTVLGDLQEPVNFRVQMSDLSQLSSSDDGVAKR